MDYFLKLSFSKQLNDVLTAARTITDLRIQIT
uniref:Uncharacterized protein n=1 Tax=Anguilla anguilla TaxID=7936 RepID=A0A0E9TAM5_ANGAN